MNIFLTLKCGFNDSFYFIQQFSSLSNIKKVFVFRDEKSLEIEKVQYVLPGGIRKSFFRLIIRFFQMLFYVPKPELIIGIYELPHGLLAMIVGKIRGVPSIVSIIGNPAYTKLRKGSRLKFTMWILKYCNFITVTGNNSRKFLIRQGIEADKIFVLPNTMDFSSFKPLVVKKEYDIISLGRISDEKHLEIIVEVIKKLKANFPNIRVGIGGSGPKKNNIIILVKELGLEDNIDICGFIPEEELTVFFNKGKVFILTSETEGFPRTIIQAAACGLPVVASNVGDISDVIDHEINGFLVNDYNNIEEYTLKIEQLLTNENIYKTFSVALNNKVRSLFVTDKAVEVLQQIINRIK